MVSFIWVAGEHWALHFRQRHPELSAKLKQVFRSIRKGPADKNYSVLRR